MNSNCVILMMDTLPIKLTQFDRFPINLCRLLKMLYGIIDIPNAAHTNAKIGVFCTFPFCFRPAAPILRCNYCLCLCLTCSIHQL